MSETSNIKNIIKQLVEEQDNIDNLVVAFSFKDSPREDKLAIGMTKHTNASWFFSAAEWIRFQVYEIVNDLRSAQMMSAALAAAADDLPDDDLEDHRERRYDA